ncbi:F0F1 ATP synthase subunit epsilon [Periweissella fabalis]|uniref:ATP synthase epsilon chain n=1 Tax=Periweissella fabalis TaxID=1070421 RepID=A0A7X6S423_9LACO|nr:F0F1 ATP synthase subunit epsilon [Periweissella fabalis]MCM0598880.1 F0F1 ATP synthase subunit epsilon [Periweissella fabalis]NKZ24542.1 F0F1 ATP synthase subunit epsilon [Periweissella fabalis]
MAEHTLAVNIVTPDGIVFTRDGVKLAVIHTISGAIGVMANHQPIVSALKIDAIKVTFADSDDEFIAVNGGFAEFSNNTLTVVAESAETAKAIDVQRAESAKHRAEQHISHANEVHDPNELARAEVALARAVNRIKIVTRK